jgi:5-methylcytosine-specific restriction endonuclease McrA
MLYTPYTEMQAKLTGLTRNEQYKLLLLTSEWRSFRETIIKRDLNKCVKCGKENDKYPIYDISHDEWVSLCQKAITEGKTEWNLDFDDDAVPLKQKQYVPPKYKIEDLVVLEVHHRYYIYNKLPWEYNLDVLISLCQDCHRQIHRTQIIYTYSDSSLTLRKITAPCVKCNGTGHLPEYHYFFNGICFDCGGAGCQIDETSTWESV